MAFHRGTIDDYQDLVARVRDLASLDNVDTAVVNAGGTGYAVGDLLEVVGGTYVEPCVVEVTAESAGVVTAVRIWNAGTYSVAPTLTNVATKCFRSNGGDDGLTLDLTMHTAGWTVHRDTTYTVGAITTERELILEGVGGGSDQIFVGMRSYNARSEEIRGIELAGFTNFLAPNTWENQPGISPGRFDLDENGAYLIAANGKMPYWISVTDRRIVGVVRAYNYYASFYIGFINAFGTPLEYPYPLFVGGNTNEHDLGASAYPWRVSQRRFGSIVNPVSVGTTLDIGPTFLRDPGGIWKGFANYEVNGFDQFFANLENSVIYPFGTHDLNNVTRFVDTADLIAVLPAQAMIWQWEKMLGASDDNRPDFLIQPTPDGSGGGLVPLVPATLMRKASAADKAVYGELDSCFSAPGGIGGDWLQPEDRYVDGNDRYIIFPHAVEGGPHYLWALKEF